MLMASPIGKEEAKEKALSFLNGRSSAKARGLNSVKALRLVKSEPCYYVFNIGSRDGFVIVSGDDCAPEILGYADSGEVDPQNMPENMKAWLQGYADQIEWMKEKGIKAQTRSIAKAGAKSAIEPLLKSEWNQYSPFNDQCPTYTKDAETKHYVTGCVATAMAQIMYYHKWPEACTAIPQYTPTGANASCPTLPALESTTFDWAKMCDTYNGSEDGTEVAKLFKYCGTAVQMNYAEGGSSASTGTAVYALMNYFGYSSGARYLGRSGYTYAQWIDIIYGELAAGRPVLYDGQSTGGGHAFVCDGYEEDDLFHINWGWGGQSNGVFRLSILAPEEQGAGGSSTSDGYRMWQSIGVGIEKTNTSPSYPEPANTNPSLEVTSFAIDGGSLTTNTANNTTNSASNNTSNSASNNTSNRVTNSALNTVTPTPINTTNTTENIPNTGIENTYLNFALILLLAVVLGMFSLVQYNKISKKDE